MMLLLSGCERDWGIASKPPAICEELLGEPAIAVTAAVVADAGTAVVPWDRFLTAFEAGCKTTRQLFP